MELKWIKLYADLFQHRKIDYISSFPGGDTIIVIWIRLLCLAGKLNNGGKVCLTDKMPYTDEMLANAFQKPVEVISKALDMFENLDMISRENGFLQICNWEKYQAVEREEKAKENNRERQKRHYEKVKSEKTVIPNVIPNANLTLEPNANLTQPNAIEKEKEIDKEIEEEIEVEKEVKKETSNTYNSILDDIPDIEVIFEKHEKKPIEQVKTDPVPTLKEVEEFVKERNSDVNPKKFFDYYNELDWKDTKGRPIANWKAKLISWEGSPGSNGKKRKPDFVPEPIEDLTSEARADLISQMFADGEEEKAWKGNQRSRTTSTR